MHMLCHKEYCCIAVYVWLGPVSRSHNVINWPKTACLIHIYFIIVAEILNYLIQMFTIIRWYAVLVARSKVKVTQCAKLAWNSIYGPLLLQGFWNKLTQPFTIMRWCGVCKNHVARSKVKVTLQLWKKNPKTALWLKIRFIIQHFITRPYFF